MKLLILANNDVGLYKFRKELIRELLNAGHEIVICLPYGNFADALMKIGCQMIYHPIERRGMNPFKDAKLLLYYQKIIKTVSPDLVITYTIKPNIYGGLACMKLNIPYFVNITGLGSPFQNMDYKRKFISFLYKNCLKNVQKVFFENVSNCQVFLNDNIISNNKCVVLNGAGVNLQEYAFQKYPAMNQEIHFLFIGRIMKEKGINELFEAAKIIRSNTKNIIFDIVGPFEEDYKSIIQKYVDDDIIRYHGFQTDVKPYIKLCHCFILPSYHEGMANTLLEAGSMGRPLITSRIHGCMEAVEDNVTGFLCDVKSADSLYHAINKFIILPYEEKTLMGIKSRELIETTFDKNEIVKKTIKELEI